MSLATKAHHYLQHQVKITHSTDNIIAFCQHLNHRHLSCTPRVLKGNFSSSTNYKPIRWPGRSKYNKTNFLPAYAASALTQSPRRRRKAFQRDERSSGRKRRCLDKVDGKLSSTLLLLLCCAHLTSRLVINHVCTTPTTQKKNSFLQSGAADS